MAELTWRSSRGDPYYQALSEDGNSAETDAAGSSSPTDLAARSIVCIIRSCATVYRSAGFVVLMFLLLACQLLVYAKSGLALGGFSADNATALLESGMDAVQDQLDAFLEDTDAHMKYAFAFWGLTVVAVVALVFFVLSACCTVCCSAITDCNRASAVQRTSVLSEVAEATGLTREHTVQIVRLLPALLPLSPVVDIFSDCNAGSQIYQSGYLYSFTAVVALMVLSWRFLIIFAALTPKPSIDKIAIVYCPGLVLYNWEYLVTLDPDDDTPTVTIGGDAPTFDDASAEPVAAPDQPAVARLPPPVLQAADATNLETGAVEVAVPAQPSQLAKLLMSLDNFRKQAIDLVFELILNPTFPSKQVAWVRGKLQAERKSYEEAESCAAKALVLLRSEVKLTGASLVMGPFFVWRSAITLSYETATGSESVETERLKLYAKVLYSNTRPAPHSLAHST